MSLPFLTLPVPGFTGPLPPAHIGAADGPWWTWWHADALVLLPAVLVAVLYVRGVGRMRSRGRHRWWRTALFLTGLLTVVLAMQSPLDELGERHFTFHMLQHEAFVLLGVPLMLLGAPTTPLLLGLPRAVRHEVVRPIAASPTWHRVVNVLTYPPLAAGLFAGILIAWHFVPGWYEAAIQQQLVHDVQHASFIGGALLFWWNVIDPAPLRSRIGYGPRMIYIASAMLTRIVIGAFLTFSTTVVYEAYEGVEPVVNLSPLADQQLGALLMWVPGVMMHVMIIGAVFIIWLSKAERDGEDERRLRAAAEARSLSSS